MRVRAKRNASGLSPFASEAFAVLRVTTHQGTQFHYFSLRNEKWPSVRKAIKPKKCRLMLLFPKKNPRHDMYQGYPNHLVGMIGFEPMVFCSQSRRDNQASLHPEAHIFSSSLSREARKKNYLWTAWRMRRSRSNNKGSNFTPYQWLSSSIVARMAA